MRRILAFFIVLSALVSRSVIADESAASESQRLRALEKAVEQLVERNAALEKQVKELQGKKKDPFAPVFAKPEKQISPGNDHKAIFSEPSPPPIAVHSAGSEFKLTLGGYVQANFETGDVSAFEGRFGQTALKDRIRLRRARITLLGDFKEDFDFKVEGDFEQSDAAITALRSVNVKTGATTTVTNSNRVEFSATDIFINYHRFAEANVKVGQYKAPFGFENLTPDTQILTIERSLPTGALTPERQIGLMLWGKPLTHVLPDEKDLLTYYVGAFNGNGRNFNNNDNNEFMYVGRLELLPWKGKLLGQESQLRLGADFLSSRDDSGTNISPALNLRVNTDGSLTSYVLTGAAERESYSFDAALKLGPFDFSAEYFNEQVDGRIVNGALPNPDFNPTGFYFQVGYFLIPGKLQAVAKWESLDPDQLPNDDIYSLTGGLNYYIHGDGIKLMANYVHTWSDFRRLRPLSGEDEFNELLVRLQVIF